MKQALEALEEIYRTGDTQAFDLCYAPNVIPALRQAIAEADKQEPVAFRNIETGEFCTGGFLRKDWAKWQPLYAAPVHASDISQERVDETPKCKDDPRAPHGFDRNASHSADRYVCECEGWERLEPMRTRIMSEAYDLADRGDSEGYNSVKVMCSDVLALIETEIATERNALDLQTTIELRGNDTPEVTPDVDKACTKVGTNSGVLHKKWRGLQDKDLTFLQLTSEVKNISKDRYNLIARQIETYLKERNTHP
jgi:hypothetical protein